MAIKQRTTSLKRRESAFSDTSYQLKVLSDVEVKADGHHRFEDKLTECEQLPLRPHKLEVLQINVGKLCNQSCAHCHVDAGPDRTEEVMSRSDLQTCLEVIEKYGVPTVDITGGAPEMNPHFRWFVEQCSNLGTSIINRCNLTIIEANPKFADLPEFFAEHRVHVISSLPYFSKRRTDSQRGDGVYDDSIKALKKLNAVGYGASDGDLTLDLVYNPTGTFLPSSQAQLQAEFKRQLRRRHGIEFNNLFAITNLPISRFLEYLVANELYEEYMSKLIEAFNPATIDGLMCRNTISVSWDGYLYDCDFNQMLDMKVQSGADHISEFDLETLSNRAIAVNQHCFGCTAGAGSSCGGEIA